MPLIALLDKNLMLKGFETVDQEEAPSRNRIPVPRDCDLKPGRYKWDADNGRFIPTAASPENAVKEHHVLREVARALIAIRDGKTFPQSVLDWLADYEVSMDNKD
jgi:hypothetical protein